MTAPVEVAVYDPDGTTLIAVVPRRDGVQWQDEMNGMGTGRFSMHLDDELLSSVPALLPALLGDGIVKVRPVSLPDPVYAWQVEHLDPVRASSEENAGRKVVVSGRHVRSLLDRATVYGDGKHRPFDFSAPIGDWYVSSEWVAPVGVQQGSDPTARANHPDGWPDPLAEWIWSSDPTATAPAERNWFRGDFTLAAETQVRIWAAADNTMSLRLNGVEVISSPDPFALFAWRDLATYNALLPAGTHTISAWVSNAAATALNPGGFLCVVGTADDQGQLDTVLLRTNTTDWLVHAAADPPGWPAGMILDTLLTEAQTAGDLNPAVTWDFTGLLDSDGVPWTDRQDVTLNVGDDLLTVSDRWAGSVYDITMTPDLVLQARQRQGSDLSGTVALGAVGEATKVDGTENYGQIRNVIRSRYGSDRIEVVDSASVALYGRRPTTLTFGDAGSAAQVQQAATAALADLAEPNVTIAVATTSAAGPQAFADYRNGDTVTAPQPRTGTATPCRVIAVTGAEVEQRIDWTTELYPET